MIDKFRGQASLLREEARQLRAIGLHHLAQLREKGAEIFERAVAAHEAEIDRMDSAEPDL